jgi:hypothetical protein
VGVTIIDEEGKQQSGNITIAKGAQVYVAIVDGAVKATDAEFPGDYRNVAFGTHVYASSQEGSHLPFSVIDGNSDTFYKTLANASAGSEFLAFRMRNLYKIDKVVMTPMEGETAPTSLTVQYSLSDGSYVDVPNTTATTDGDKIVVSFPEVQASFVKVKLNGGSNRVAVKKLAVYGKPAESTFNPIPTAITTATKSSVVKSRKIYTTKGEQVGNFTTPGCYIIEEQMSDGTKQIKKELRK